MVGNCKIVRKVCAVSSQEVLFQKYSGTGNDFVIFDNRNNELDMENRPLWQKICDRKVGIGADGVIFLCKSESYDFKMIYLNADGGEVSMCGNGTRCLTHFAAKSLKIGNGFQYQFETKNGVYFSTLIDDEVKVQMTELYDDEKFDISDLYQSKNSNYLNTGVPHCIYECEELESLDLVAIGRKIRYDNRFESGVNANFFEILSKGKIKLRTYERGVEDETLACGTGAVAAAVSCSKFYGWQDGVTVKMPGGTLRIEFNEDFSKVFLCGKVQKIFSGVINIQHFL